MPQRMPHERLIVYQKSAELFVICTTLTANASGRHWSLVDQLLRAVSSIALNIAEGCSEFSGRDKARFYRFARRSAGEAAAAIDLLRRVGIIAGDDASHLIDELEQIAAMLVNLAKRVSRPQPP